MKMVLNDTSYLKGITNIVLVLHDDCLAKDGSHDNAICIKNADWNKTANLIKRPEKIKFLPSFIDRTKPSIEDIIFEILPRRII